jgi:hypothetical protein
MAKITSSEDSKNVGRPGFKGFVPGPRGKDSVRTLRVNDPADGRTQPGAKKITTTHIDLVGNLGRPLAGLRSNVSFAKGKKTIKAAGSRLRKR